MKKIILTIIFAISIAFTLKSQITLEHTYTNGRINLSNFSQYGYKYWILNSSNNLLIVYNTNHSVFKTIPLNPPSGGYQYYSNLAWHPEYTLTDNLFNSDSLIEILMIYYKQITQGSSVFYDYQGVIFNENNATILNLGRCAGTKLYNISGNYKLNCIRSISNPASDTSLVYSLPGTLPCDACGGQVGIVKHDKTISTMPNAYPNPTSSQITIPYTFTNSESEGTITVYDINGKIIKTYKVDKTFENLVIDTNEFGSGTYYYNLTTKNDISGAKKIIVIK